MRDYMQTHIKPYIVPAVLTLVIGAGLGVLLARSAAGEKIFQAITDAFAEKDLLTTEGGIHVGKLFLNNVVVALVSVLLGLVPFLYLPAAVGLVNGLVIGVILGLSELSMPGVSPFIMLLAGILPHGIFELTAFVLAMAMGLGLCRKTSEVVRGRAKMTELKVRLPQVVFYFLKVLVPLLLVAALVETYVTSSILAMALGL